MSKVSKNAFEIQVSTDIIRNPKLSNKAFVVWVRLTQLYHGVGCKEEIQLLHKKLMEYTRITENRTFKDILHELYEFKLVKNKIETLPRTNPIVIHMNEDYIPVKNDKLLFTQLTENLINKKVIDEIGHVGVRLMYYYKSRINYDSISTSYCYASEETIGDEIGVNRKTVIKYNKVLAKFRFVKIEKQETERDYYTNEKKDIYGFWKYNNHVYVNAHKINEYAVKNADKIVI